MLEVRNLDGGYDFLQVLRDVSLRVDAGQWVSLVGPNGAGKTTLLKTIAGLIPPQRGQILFRDRPVANLPAHTISRLGITLVSETLNLFRGMSVYENLLLGGYAVKEKSRKESLLEQVFRNFPRLEERRHQLAGTLSGGERKMLAIGRALMSAPALLLVDEPSIGLSPRLTRSVFQALQALRQKGMTIFLVEQNVKTTLSLSDRAYVLEQGRIVIEGRGRDLLQNAHVQNAYLGH